MIEEYADDFADDKEIQRLRRIQEEYEEMIEESANVICRELGLEKEESPEEVGSYLMVNSMEDPFLITAYYSADKEVQVLFMEYRTTFRGGKSGSGSNGTVDLYIFGKILLRKEYPHACLYPETFGERIANWFTKSDLDFKEYKKFSRSFHLITKDKEKLSLLLFNKPLDDLAAFPGMEAEINGNSCLFRTSQNPVSLGEAYKFIELVKAMRKVLL